MATFVYLMGGLGNQLFQYAYAQHLITSGVPVAGLLTNSYDTDTHDRRPLVSDISSLPAIRVPPTLAHEYRMVQEEDGERLLDLLRQQPNRSGHLVCKGYWQGPTHADAVRALLTSELTASLPTEYRSDSSKIAECMLHVRRRDYGHHGLVPVSYYKSCLEQAGWPRFAVVTDEPNFCSHEFAGLKGYCGITRGDTRSPWSDFYLMAKARSQVIANSSFSWWTAWLGVALGFSSRVYAPAEWSLIDRRNPCPTGWTAVECRLVRP